MTTTRPSWLKLTYHHDEVREDVQGLLNQLSLKTVCQEANCPNFLECFSKKTATFMILGTNCTRNCRFCNVTNGTPTKVDAEEPDRVAEAVKQLRLCYAVITSVTRDDLPDGGANHFANVIHAIKDKSPETAIEVLISDLGGDVKALKTVVEAEPTVISHNMETVKSLYKGVRPQAVYERSLIVLKNIKKLSENIHSKTGIMVGLGENEEQVESLMDDLRSVGCEFLTIGQYLRPSLKHHPIIEYVTPEQFERYGKMAYRKGFKFVASAPLVRSSYHAGEAIGLG